MEDIIIYQRSTHIVKKVFRCINGKNQICILKEGIDNINEAETMKYIKNNTNIPIPEVYEYDRKHILMEYIKGDTLESILENLEKEKINNKNNEEIINNRIEKLIKNVEEQLKEYINEMRKHIFLYIGSINNKPCYESFSDNLIGPFNNNLELNNFRINKLIVDEKNIKDYLEKNKNFKTKFVLTHNDLGPYNIMIDNFKITSILDWECSGSYPEYWEYTSNIFHCAYNNEWKDIIKKILEKTKKEINDFEFIIYYLNIYSNLNNDDETRKNCKNNVINIINKDYY